MVDIHVAPENVDTFLEGLKISYDGVAAEPECILYDLFVDKEDLGHLRIVEVCNASYDWMQDVRQSKKLPDVPCVDESQVQLEKSYYGPYLEKTTPLWTAPRKSGPEPSPLLRSHSTGQIRYYTRQPGFAFYKQAYVSSSTAAEPKI